MKFYYSKTNQDTYVFKCSDEACPYRLKLEENYEIKNLSIEEKDLIVQFNDD